MRTTHRVLSTAIALGAIFPFGLPVADAAELKLPVDVAAWFWDDQSDDVRAQVPRNASGVPADGLAVAITDGAGRAPETQPNDPKDPADDEAQKRSNKETFLSWNLDAIPTGSIVDSFSVTLLVDPAGRSAELPPLAVPGQVPRGGQPSIMACRPLVGFGEADGAGYADKPALDCRDAATGAYDAKTDSYTFDLTVFAQDWVDGLIDNFGVGLRPDVEEDDPFQVTFMGAPKIVTTATFTAAEETIEEVIAPPPTPEEQTTFDSGSSDSGSTDLSFAPTVEVLEAPAPVAQPAPAPAPAAASAPAVVVTTVAARPMTRDLSVGPSFWLSLLAAVGLLGIVSLVLGDPVVPVTGQRTPSRIPLGRTAPAGATLRPRTSVAIRPRSI
ncbi:MAG TPA: hypothetical protein VNB94_06920 [Mycobacteriales bacterium]|nr:hypothetical protein [Mycobacteriales bacterium]